MTPISVQGWRMVPMGMRLLVICALVLLVGLATGCSRNAQDESTVVLNGSTTLSPIAQAWAESFMDDNPDVAVAVSGAGSGNGIAALINGTTDIAMASREMKDKEREAITSGPATKYVIGYDALAVIVHPDNPIENLTLDQCKDIFTGRITNWRDVGGPNAAITVYTRDSASGTYEFFFEHVLGKEEFASTARMTNSNSFMTKSIAGEEYAIGYSGLAFVDATVKALGIAADGKEPVRPTLDNAKNKSYPIVRDLNMYTVGEAQGLTRTFLDFGFSPEGQAAVQQAGYVPVR